MDSTTSTSLSNSLPDRNTADRAAQGAHTAVDRLAAGAVPTVERLRTAASRAAEKLQSQADTLSERQAKLMESARGYVRENPGKAIGFGLLAGIVISRLIR